MAYGGPGSGKKWTLMGWKSVETSTPWLCKRRCTNRGLILGSTIFVVYSL